MEELCYLLIDGKWIISYFVRRVIVVLVNEFCNLHYVFLIINKGINIMLNVMPESVDSTDRTIHSSKKYSLSLDQASNCPI